MNQVSEFQTSKGETKKKVRLLISFVSGNSITTADNYFD